MSKVLRRFSSSQGPAFAPQASRRHKTAHTDQSSLFQDWTLPVAGVSTFNIPVVPSSLSSASSWFPSLQKEGGKQCFQEKTRDMELAWAVGRNTSGEIKQTFKTKAE